MNSEVQTYIEKHSIEVQDMFFQLRTLILESAPREVEEKLWAKLPSYYVNDNFVRLIPFKDHINVEAISILKHQEELSEFKITPKGMLQLYLNQRIPTVLLQTIFQDTLLGQY